MSAGVQRPPVLPAVPRLEARKQAERAGRRRRRLRAGLAVLALVPIGVLAWLLLSSPLLQLRSVEVEGNRRLSTAAVVTTAGVDLGTSLARVDTSAVRERVAALAPVADVEVHRTWPGTLSVRVQERVGVAVVDAGVPGRWRLVDPTGTAFTTVDERPPGLPRLSVGPTGPAPDDRATTAGLAVLGDLPAALHERVETVTATSPTTVTLILDEGRTVVWGEAQDGERKAAVVQALLERRGRTLDVSSPDVAVVR